MEEINPKPNQVNSVSEPIPSGETLNALRLQYELPPETTWEEIQQIINDPTKQVPLIKHGDKIKKEI